MKPEDRKAYEEWRRIGGYIRPPSCDAENAWEAACSHRDAQTAGAQGEPDAFIRVKSGKIVGQSVHDEMPDGIYELHPWGAVNQAPAAAINEQLLEALKELMYARTDKAEGMADAAIAAAEAEKARGRG